MYGFFMLEKYLAQLTLFNIQRYTVALQIVHTNNVRKISTEGYEHFGAKVYLHL